MVIWEEYYEHFNLERSSVREGCEPRIMVHDSPTEKAIVLIHGLTDSPFFMEAIGEYFYKWGYNVFIPLLDGHGLKKPKFMRGTKLETWIENVDFALQTAQKKCRVISIGGLSTGGTLSVLKIFDSPDEITGGIFLFSAALDIATVAGNLIEKLLRTRILLPTLAYLQDKLGKKLIGDHPYRYSRMDYDGARELSRLIDKIDHHFNRKFDKSINNHNITIDKPIFAAHSEYDRVADIKGVEKLIAKSKQDKTKFFRIAKHFHVPHATVVLKEDVLAESGFLLEQKNPFFDEMMNAVNKFQEQHL